MAILHATYEEVLLDNMSDGQWHTLAKIQRHSGKDFPSQQRVTTFLDELVTQEWLLQIGKSYRFQNPFLESWRISRNLQSKGDKDLNSPRYFGSILEDDGWLLAPLRSHDLVHFRASGDITREVVQRRIGFHGVASQDSDGLMRISTLYGDPIYCDIKEWGKQEGVDISGVRLDKNVRRRELADLPTGFVSDLCEFYGTFARTLLRNVMTIINTHISDPDDAQQQIYMWIIHAIQRYDAKTAIPFAAYLHSSLQRWVHDLNRKSYGRAAADTELKYSKAISAFTAEHGRQPTSRELALILNEDESVVNEKKASIARVNSLRTVATLDDGEFEIPIADESTVESDFHSEIETTLLSAALTSSALESTSNAKILAWLGVYAKTWGGTNKLPITKRQAEETLLVSMRTKVEEILR